MYALAKPSQGGWIVVEGYYIRTKNKVQETDDKVPRADADGDDRVDGKLDDVEDLRKEAGDELDDALEKVGDAAGDGHCGGVFLFEILDDN
jgi:hypothetical protein